MLLFIGPHYDILFCLTHWGRETHICVGKLSIISSDNGLSPGRRHTIIWTNAGILSIGPIGTIFNEILIEMHTFSFKKINFKMSSGKWRPFCLGLNMITGCLHFLGVLKLSMCWGVSSLNHWNTGSVSSCNGYRRPTAFGQIMLEGKGSHSSKH